MQTFKQYLKEDFQLIKLSSLDAIKKEYAPALHWFGGGWMRPPMTPQDEKDVKTALQKLNALAGNKKTTKNPLYRIFADDDIYTMLSSEQLVEFKSANNEKDKIDLLNKYLDKKQVAVNTSNKNIQSWADSLTGVNNFHKYISFHQSKHEFYVVVASSFTQDEKLFSIDEFNVLIRMSEDQLWDSAKKNEVQIYDYAYFNQVCDIMLREFENQHETVVDTRMPRTVKIEKIVKPNF
jgi:hypothetical protein